MKEGKNSMLVRQPKCYIFSVHASNKSQTALHIIRKEQFQGLSPISNNQSQNPYVFKPKSYSSKRTLSRQHSAIPSALPSKKVKKDFIASSSYQDEKLDLLSLESLIEQTDQNHFSFNRIPLEKLSKKRQVSRFPISREGVIVRERNELLNRQIQIVSNENKKISVPIHQSIYKSNTSQGDKKSTFLENVLNPFDYKTKNQYTETLHFQRDYKSGYAPIDMQLKNSDNPQQTYTGSTAKNHFIKKKQSTLSLPRTCGVSYIKPSESHQTKPYEPLPSLIFQSSTSCENNEQFKKKFALPVNEFIKISQNNWFPYIKTGESQMRSLLLGQKVGTVGWIKGIDNAWPMLVDGTFILFLYTRQFPTTQEQIWEALKTAAFKIGILSKRSTSGKKAFFKSVGLQGSNNEEKNHLSEEKIQENEQIHQDQKANLENQNHHSEKHNEDKSMVEEVKNQNSMSLLDLKNNESATQLKKVESFESIDLKSVTSQLVTELKDSKNVVTLSLRLQLYVNQNDWKEYPKEEKNLLNFMITSLKDYLEKKSMNIIRDRVQLSKCPNKQEKLQNYLNLFRKSKKGIQQETKKSHREKPKQKFSAAFLSEFIQLQQINHQKNEQNLEIQTTRQKYNEIKIQSSWDKYLKMPIYYISTRDSFAFDLIQKVQYLKRGQKIYKKIDYYFEPDNLPANFTGQYKKYFPDFHVGITCYHDFFTDTELKYFEGKTFEIQENAFKSKFLPMTVQPSIVGQKIKRTKFFFGYRYMWTKCQLSEPASFVGAGVRKDVSKAPSWIQQIQKPLIENGIVQKNFLNSTAINVYHDGREGLAQHFDDAVRFKQPIYTLRLFSDARLSFGSQFYGFCNGAFIIPLPRGCICVMLQNSYAANGVKHCVRPCDMTGKSAAVIMRQMHHQVVNEASRYDELVDFPAWLSALSEHPNSLTYGEQKRREAEYLMNSKTI